MRGAGQLRHGEILIMGGDQCYPQATREDYKHRLLLPFNWAFSSRTADRKLFAIPGNHDWYDGLNAFDSLFCSSRDRLSAAKGNVIGGWQCQQHRSYWAIRLPHNWWIWGADIQFSKYLDTAQVNYFETMAAQMQKGDNLIICLAEPSWMIADLQGHDEEENFFKITSIARDKGAQRGRRHRRRLAPLQPLLRPRARRALHHLGRRRRLPAPHPRAEEQHPGALAGAARGRAGRCRRGARRASRRGLEGARVRHPPQAQHAGGRQRRRAGRAGRPGRAASHSSRPGCGAAACPCSRRRPSAIRARPRAISSASGTCCSRSTTRPSPSASAFSTGSSPGSSRRSSPGSASRGERSTISASARRCSPCCRSCRSMSFRPSSPRSR